MIAAVGLIAMMSNALLGPLFDPKELDGDKQGAVPAAGLAAGLWQGSWG
jgi:hypothetical protein